MDATDERIAMLIGLTGYVGSGKSTVADILVKQHGFMRMRFAQPLKDMLKAVGLSDRELDGDLKTTPCALLGGKTPRHALVTLGTEWGRQMIDWDMWVRALMQRIDTMPYYGRGGADIVVDDCRFVNEIEAVRQRGGQIWKIDRPGCVALTDHPSEREHEKAGFDRLIVNHRTVDHLRESVRFSLLPVPGPPAPPVKFYA